MAFRAEAFAETADLSPRRGHHIPCILRWRRVHISEDKVKPLIFGSVFNINAVTKRLPGTRGMSTPSHPEEAAGGDVKDVEVLSTWMTRPLRTLYNLGAVVGFSLSAATSVSPARFSAGVDNGVGGMTLIVGETAAGSADEDSRDIFGVLVKGTTSSAFFFDCRPSSDCTVSSIGIAGVDDLLDEISFPASAFSVSSIFSSPSVFPDRSAVPEPTPLGLFKGFASLGSRIYSSNPVMPLTVTKSLKVFQTCTIRTITSWSSVSPSGVGLSGLEAN